MAFTQSTEFHLGKGEVAISCRKNPYNNKYLLGLYDIEEGFETGEATNGQAKVRKGGAGAALYFHNSESVDIMIRHLEEIRALLMKEDNTCHPIRLAEKISGW